MGIRLPDDIKRTIKKRAAQRNLLPTEYIKFLIKIGLLVDSVNTYDANIYLCDTEEKEIKF